MKNQVVREYIEHYTSLDDPRYAVLIKGKWGCGKTYFIQNILKEWNNDNSYDDDGYIIKPIYVSLNGISTIKALTYALNKEISPILYSKAAQIVTKVGKAFFKGMLKFDFDSDDNGKADITFEASPLDIFTSEYVDNSIKGKRVIIFDDWERCKISAYELFGYINNFIEHQRCKVILIGNEDKLGEDEKQTYLNIKEKLIGQIFSLEEDLDSAVNQFLTDIRSNSTIEILTKNKELISSIFKAGRTQNLRVLRQSFLDFDRLLNFLDFEQTRYDNEKKYKLYITNILANYILTYCEYKSGNTDIANFQNYKAHYEAQKENKETGLIDLARKYENLLKSKNIKGASESISIQFLIEFIENGVFSTKTKNSITERREEWLFSRDIQPWEILYYKYELTNEIFENNIKIIINDFFNDKLQAVFEVLHISSLLLFYSKEGTIKRIGNSKIKKQAIKTINRIYKDNYNLNTVHTLLRDENTRIADYADKSEVFDEIFNYAYTQKNKLLEERIDAKLINSLESLDDSTIKQLEGIIREVAQVRKIGGDSFGIFNGVSVSKFGKRILKLSIHSKYELKFFFQERYCVEGSKKGYRLGENQKDDLDFFIALKAFLDKQVKKQVYMDKHTIIDLIKTIKNIIEKMSE